MTAQQSPITPGPEGSSTFTIGPLFHLIHVSDDFWALNDWYADVFEPIEFSERSSDGRAFPTMLSIKRDASLVAIADVCIEPMSPSKFIDGWEQSPIGKFYTRFGRHWHSVSWYTHNNLGLYRRLKDKNYRIFFTSGESDATRPPTPTEALCTHPRETIAALEFIEGPEALRGRLDDVRFEPGYDHDRWAREHPLGLRRLAYITLVVNDLARAKRIYVDTLGGVLVGTERSQLTCTENAYVALGTHTVFELARPVDGDSVAADDLARNGEVMHAVAFEVADLDRAQAHLESKGVTVVARDDDTLLTDSETTFGAPFRFTRRQFADALLATRP